MRQSNRARPFYAREMRIPLPANARSRNHAMSGLKAGLAAQS
jgi:hypothetical protein